MSLKSLIIASALFFTLVEVANAQVKTAYYNGHRYDLISSTDWNSAKSTAAGNGGYIASITDSSENAWVASEFCSEVDESTYNYEFWIGLAEAGGENNWTWESGESFVYNSLSYYQPWRSTPVQEPNNVDGIEDAVVFRCGSALYGDYGTWNDAPRGLSRLALLEYVVSITPTATFTPSNTPTNTATYTPSNTPTDTPTFTPSNTPTFTPTFTNTPTDTPTNTPTYTPTNTSTFTPTYTPTFTSTPTATPTRTCRFYNIGNTTVCL